MEIWGIYKETRLQRNKVLYQIISNELNKYECSVCKKTIGWCIKCIDKDCKVRFHPLCINKEYCKNNLQLENEGYRCIQHSAQPNKRKLIETNNTNKRVKPNN